MTRKHVLEYFKGDPWQVRIGVLIGAWAFQLALAALLTGGAAHYLGPALWKIFR